MLSASGNVDYEPNRSCDCRCVGIALCSTQRRAYAYVTCDGKLVQVLLGGCNSSNIAVSADTNFLRSCFYASRLHSGLDAPVVEVSLVCRSNYRPIAERGVILRTRTFGSYTFTPKYVFSSVQEAAKQQEPWDYIVVTTKALPEVSDDSKAIQPLVGNGQTTIVLIQNGVRLTHFCNSSPSEQRIGWCGGAIPQKVSG